jgi:hypothetical protein
MLNANKKKRIKKAKRQNTHMDHEPSPLSNMIMPNVKPIAKFMDICLINNP